MASLGFYLLFESKLTLFVFWEASELLQFLEEVACEGWDYEDGGWVLRMQGQRLSEQILVLCSWLRLSSFSLAT